MGPTQPPDSAPFGLMNIIFGSILLLTAIGYGAFYIYAPIIQKQFQSPITQIQEKEKADRAAKIAELKASEAAAKTEDEKKALAEERAAIESKPLVNFSALQDLQNMTAYNEPKLAIYEIFDISTAVVLNVLMIVAGGGLMGLKEWARRLAIWVAGLKILRWVFMVLGSMVWLIPMTLDRMEKAMAAVDAQIRSSGGGVPPFSMAQVTRWSVMAGAVIMVFSAIVASVYPAMMWWYLSRPAARAACMKKPSQPDLAEPVQS